jgi:hypothetical protein
MELDAMIAKVPHAFRAHPFVTLLVAGLLLGGGLRFVPAAGAGTSAASHSTACAAK